LLLNFAANPLRDARRIARDGSGLNPLLAISRDGDSSADALSRLCRIHRAFAFALGALAMRYPGEKWIHITRRWTMVTWGFLTCGIFLGAHWAYSVLGWGGYWGWDPVENASLMPWLTGTAFLHSVMMQEKRGMLKTWNMWLIFSTFMLSIFGTFLTRSGVVSSVHAFAQSSIGDWFVAFLALIIFATCLLLLCQEPLPPAQRAQAGIADLARIQLPVQQFALAAGRLLHGSVGNAVSRALRMGAGNQGHGRTAVFQSRKHSGSLAASSADRSSDLCSRGAEHHREPETQLQVAGHRRAFLHYVLLSRSACVRGKTQSYFYSLMTIMLSVLVALTVISEFVRGGRVIAVTPARDLLASMLQLAHRNTRRYGGYIVHFGVIVIMIGFAGSAFNQDKEQEMGFGDKMTIGPTRWSASPTRRMTIRTTAASGR
jgi:cytochrome c-type biogenesis protein CcmF